MMAALGPVEVHAEIADDLQTVQVAMRASIGPGERIHLLAERFRSVPKIRPETVRELFPGEISIGGFELESILVDGRPCEATSARASDGAVELIPCPGERVEVRGRVIVPRRFGAFGVIDRSLTLAGGWYPVLARRGRPPPRRPLLVSVSVPADSFALIGTSPFFPRKERRLVETRLEAARNVPLVLRPATARVVSFGEGLVRFVVGPASELEPPRRPERLSAAFRALDDGVSFLRETGLGPLSRCIVVEAPLRHELVELGEGVVFVSDHAFRLTPLSRFQKFHRLPILRSVFGALVERSVAEDDALTRSVLADALASAILDQYVASRFGSSEDAFDVLGTFSFIPSIDSMLYAPDLPFVAAYFRLVREDDPLHVDFVDAPATLPRGKLLYEKLSDLIGAKAASDALLAGRSRRAFDVLGDDADAFVATWLGPYPNVRYRLAGVIEDGGRVAVAIERSGDVVGEPITVSLIDVDGAETLVRSSTGTDALRTVTATLGAKLALVELDPRQRVAEAPTVELPSPRVDNRSEPSWKVLLNNFNLLISATEGQIDTALDLGFSRRYDVTESFAARADYSPQAIGLSGRWRRSFGDPATPARLTQSFTLTLGGEYLRAGFVEGAEAGAAGTASLSYSYDDRVSIWAPEGGSGLRATFTYSHVLGVDGSEGPSADALSFAVRGVRQWQLGARHQLAVRGAVGTYLAGTPREQLAFALGGRGNVRGYAVSAVLARHRALLSGEWLHPLLPDTELDAFQLFFVNGIDGVAFGDVAVAADELGALSDGPLFSDVGYGLRFYFDYAGVRPSVMSVDVAWPIERPPRGPWLPAVYIDFAQSFGSF